MAIQNSSAKIYQAGKSFSRSLALIGRYAKELDEGKLYARLMELGKRLTDAPETSDLEPIFKIEREIGPKVTKFTRTKSETAALGRFQRASDQLLRFADKMEDGSALLERMEAASKLDLTKVADLQPIFALCDDVFAAVGAFQNGEIVRKIDRVLKGWLTAKTGEVGRYAEAFKSTEAYTKALAWKANMPLPNADYRAFKDWRNAGYELLKGALEAPWGYFQCKGHGEAPVKVMPIQPKTGKWFIPKECHTCHSAGQSSVSEYTSPRKTKPGNKIDPNFVPKTREQVKAAKRARQQVIQDNLAKEMAELQGMRPGQHRDGAAKKAKDAAKEARKQGGHPEEEKKATKKKGSSKGK